MSNSASQLANSVSEGGGGSSSAERLEALTDSTLPVTNDSIGQC